MNNEERQRVELNKMLKGTVIAVYGNNRLFGERMGWSEATVSQVLHGRRRLTKKDRAKISQVLGVPLRILFPNEAE